MENHPFSNRKTHNFYGHFSIHHFTRQSPHRFAPQEPPDAFNDLDRGPVDSQNGTASGQVALGKWMGCGMYGIVW